MMTKWRVLLKTVPAVLALGACALLAATAMAADAKPVAVVSFAGYDSLKADLGYVGRVSDNPELETNLEAVLKLFTQNKGLVGLDKSRPWGAVIGVEGERLSGYAFLPVDDLDSLLAVLEPWVGKPDKGSDGVYQVTQGRRPLFFKTAGRWAIMGQRSEALDAATADPAALVADLTEHYDLAARVYVENIPESLRDKLLGQMKQGIQRDLEKRPGESDADYATRVEVTEKMASAIEGVLGDLSEVTIGGLIDGKTEQVHFDISLSFKPGSQSDQQAAALVGLTSQYAGFQVPGAALSGHVTGVMPEEKAAIINTVLEAVRAKGLEDIEGKGQPEEVRDLMVRLVNDACDTLGQTVSSREVDGAMSVVLKPDGMTVVAGQRWVDASRMADVARRFVDLADQHRPDVSELIKLDAETWNAVTLHTASIPIPPDAKNRERITQLVGEQLDVVVGLSEKSLYVAAGRNAMATLKAALERSASPAAVGMVTVSVALKPLAEFVAEMGEPKDREKAAAVARVLSDAAGADHITLTGESIPHGLRYRLEFESGVVRLIGVAARDRLGK